jgi:hypothetical protein
LTLEQREILEEDEDTHKFVVPRGSPFEAVSSMIVRRASGLPTLSTATRASKRLSFHCRRRSTRICAYLARLTSRTSCQANRAAAATTPRVRTAAMAAMSSPSAPTSFQSTVR